MKLLLIEDDAITCGQLTETLSRFDIEVTPAQDPSTALPMFKPGKFDVALIDLILSPDYGPSSQRLEYKGISIGSNIRAMDSNILIVMYSAAITNKQEDKFPHYSECFDAGADKVVSREYITSIAPNNLAKFLLNWKREKKDNQNFGIRVQIANNFATKAVVEKVGGENILLDILRQTIPGHFVFKVESLSGGYSGAIVLRVQSKSSETSNDNIQSIVKISKSSFALNDELRRRPFEGSLFDSHAIVPRANYAVKVEDWYAFSVSEIRGAFSLEELLTNRKLNRNNKAILRRVVKDILLEPALNSRPLLYDEIKNPFNLRYTFLSTIDEVLAELSDYCNSFRNESISSIKVIKNYLNDCVEGYYPFVTNLYRVASLHGDLHCRNILIKNRSQPILIDFGRADIYPRLFDCACLEVDLLIRVKDKNFAKHWDPKRIEKWIEIALVGFPFTSDEPPPIDCISFLRYELHQVISNNIPSVSKREYAEALLFELFRYLKFQNIPIFKKVVCTEMISNLIRILGILR